MAFGRNSEQQYIPLAISVSKLRIGSGVVPVVKIDGLVPPGSEGNSVVESCFNHMYQALNIPASKLRLLIYDMNQLQYEFGDHLGAYLWNQPALLDGVAIIVVSSGSTLCNLLSLRDFIGSWIPVCFYDSIEAISADVVKEANAIKMLMDKRDACSMRGRVIPTSRTGVRVVLLGSRQTGEQYQTGRRFHAESDLDCGVVGGPQELAILSTKQSYMPGNIANLNHPPIKTFSSIEEAVEEGLFVVLPRNNQDRGESL